MKHKHKQARRQDEFSVRKLQREMTEQIDLDIDELRQRGIDNPEERFINGPQLAKDLSEKPKYQKYIDALARPLALSRFNEIVSSRLHAATDPKDSGQLTLPGWHSALPGALCREKDGQVVYVFRNRTLREDYEANDRLKSAQIENDIKSRSVMREHNDRLEVLRQQYGDIYEGELIRRAMQDARATDQHVDGAA